MKTFKKDGYYKLIDKYFFIKDSFLDHHHKYTAIPADWSWTNQVEIIHIDYINKEEGVLRIDISKKNEGGNVYPQEAIFKEKVINVYFNNEKELHPLVTAFKEISKDEAMLEAL